MNRLAACVFGIALVGSLTQPAAAQTTWNLSTGVGDGSVSLKVDQYGTFSSYSYDPIGPLTPTFTGMGPQHAQIYIRFGAVGPRPQLIGPATPLSGVPNTSCTGTFTYSGKLSVKLDQKIAPLMVGPVNDGFILQQDYTITNISAVTQNFELVRYYHAHLGGTNMGGGRKMVGPIDQYYLFAVPAPSPTTLLMQVDDSGGGTAPATGRWEFDVFDNLQPRITAGNMLQDKFPAGVDANADGLIDVGKEGHYVWGLCRTFSLAPGASAVYTNRWNSTGTGSIPTAGVSVVQPGGETRVQETGPSQFYTVVLNAAPTANVTVSMTPSPAQLKLSPSSLTFTNANWNTPQTVTVWALNDSIFNGIHMGSIAHTCASLDPSYNGIPVPTIPVTIDDAPIIHISTPGEGTFRGCVPTGLPAVVHPGEGSHGSFGFGGGQRRLGAALFGPLPDSGNGAMVFNVSFREPPQATGNGVLLTSLLGLGLFASALVTLVYRKAS